MSVLYDDVQMEQKTARNTKVFEISAVTIKISMTEDHHWRTIRPMVYSNTEVYGGNGKSGHLYIQNYFHFFETFNDAFKVQFFQA